MTLYLEGDKKKFFSTRSNTSSSVTKSIAKPQSQMNAMIKSHMRKASSQDNRSRGPSSANSAPQSH